MERKFLKAVTVTGADDSVSHNDLLDLAKQYPYVEFGILLSRSSEGIRSRFPSLNWMRGLALLNRAAVRLSGHLCGSWVREVCAGDWSFLKERQSIAGIFSRFQLNFHGLPHSLRLDFSTWPNHYQIIFQLDGLNDGLLSQARAAGINAVGLFDLSHGGGVLPDSWPVSNEYAGYAGGLSAENVAAQLERIAGKAGVLAWIDAETRLRSDNDRQFDLNKVADFLQAARPWVIDHAEADQEREV